ncbi:MAG: RNA-binding S4 domain-containing protein [Candidatus Omnitrophica bacterium]|nr:RNA-binding S4 domain-containing protein [Candidatus Omnitrophota bacterium]
MNQINFLQSVRIDKWLWAVRVCKTRKGAGDLCQRGKVFLDQQLAKPSREVKPGQVVGVNREGIHWVYRVLQCVDKRVGAVVAATCMEDLTPESEKERLRMIKGSWTPRRPKGMGRPTKKDRRTLDKFVNQEKNAEED